MNENSDGGTAVGDLVQVFTTDNDVLHYWLRGPGDDKFNVSARDGGAQITVAPGAVLDYEAKQTYDLVLNVSDGKDHENNPEEYFTADDTILTQVNLVNVPPGVLVDVDKANPRIGETVKITGAYLELQGYVPASANWEIRFVDANPVRKEPMRIQPNGNGVYHLTGTGAAGAKHYQLLCHYSVRVGHHDVPKTLYGDFTINWLPASQ